MEFITYEQEGFVGILTINRPKALNALNSQVLDELNETIDSIDINETRALILTGAGDKSLLQALISEKCQHLQRQKVKLLVRKVMMFSETWKH